MKKTRLVMLLLLAGCDRAELRESESHSVLTAERPHDGTWELIGQKPIIPTDDHREVILKLDELELAPDANGAEAIQREGDEGDHPVFVDDEGQLFLRTDRRIDLSALREGRPFLPEDAGLNGGEAGGDVDKDIYGSDDREWWSDTLSYPARAHVALRSSPDTTTHFCTGSAIGPRHVLTAGHCLYRDGAFTKDRASIRVVFGQNGSGNDVENTPHGKRSVVAWVLPNGWINNETRRYDYALLILEDESYSPGWLGFAAYSFTTLTGLGVNVNGYPGHSYSCAASPRADGLCGGYLYHTYGSLIVVTTDELLGQLDWEHGNSGGPLYRLTNGDRYVVGIVSASNPVYSIAARMRTGMSDALCSWIGSYPSSYFSHNCQ